MIKLTPLEIIRRVGEFVEWEDKKALLEFRKEMFSAYDALTEEEQEEVDESMVMEHISMVYSCYEEM